MKNHLAILLVIIFVSVCNTSVADLIFIDPFQPPDEVAPGLPLAPLFEPDVDPPEKEDAGIAAPAAPEGQGGEGPGAVPAPLGIDTDCTFDDDGNNYMVTLSLNGNDSYLSVGGINSSVSGKAIKIVHQNADPQLNITEYVLKLPLITKYRWIEKVDPQEILFCSSQKCVVCKFPN